MPTVKMKANLGGLDAAKWKLPKPEAAKDGELVEVDERQANILVNVLKCAEPAKEKTASEVKTIETKPGCWTDCPKGTEPLQKPRSTGKSSNKNR